MTPHAGFHAPNGGADFLGYRRNRAGRMEVIYDDGINRRMVWRVSADAVDEDGLAAALSDTLSGAAGALRVVPALMTELKRRAIPVERVTG